MPAQNNVSGIVDAARPAASLRRRSTVWHTLWKHKTEYLMISPFFIIFAIFQGYPAVWALWLSFQKWQGIGQPKWYGLGNYQRLLNSDTIWNAFRNSLIFLGIMLPLIVVATLILATILNNPKIIGRQVFRVLFFLPYVTSAVIVAIIFQLLLNDNMGWINGLLQGVGLARIAWLSQAWPARISVMLMVFWSVAGYNVLLMLGGLQGIPTQLYDAADVDGANTFQKFVYVTVPMMRGVILFVAITSTIGLLNLFSQPWLLFSGTSGMGPDQSVATLNTIQYSTAFQSSRFGEAAALGFIIGIIVIVASLIQLRLTRTVEA